MIELTLSQPDGIRQMIKYNVSPLFELASSLYELAQKQPHPRFEEWAAYTLKTFTSERLLAEWDYVMPVFQHRIPQFFDSLRTQNVMSVDEQYEYFVDLTLQEFTESLEMCLAEGKQQPSETAPPITVDLQSDPELVKGRFTLFISSYWQLLFEEKWEQLAPKFVREAEKMEAAFRNADDTAAFLTTISARFSFDPSSRLLSIDRAEEPSACEDARLLMLYPSFFYTGSPAITVHDQNVLLVYNFITRSDPAK